MNTPHKFTALEIMGFWFGIISLITQISTACSHATPKSEDQPNPKPVIQFTETEMRYSISCLSTDHCDLVIAIDCIDLLSQTTNCIDT